MEQKKTPSGIADAKQGDPFKQIEDAIKKMIVLCRLKSNDDISKRIASIIDDPSNPLSVLGHPAFAQYKQKLITLANTNGHKKLSNALGKLRPTDKNASDLSEENKQKTLDMLNRLFPELAQQHLSSILTSQAIKAQFYSAIENGQADIVSSLLPQISDADVSQDMSNGSTILHMAAQRGHAKVVKALLKDKRVNPNKQNDEGANALHLAAEKGHNDVVVSLLSFDDIEINAKLLGGFTALHLAAQHGKLQVAKTLLDNERIKPEQRNDQNMSALHVAAKNGHADVVAALLLKLSPTEINAEVSLKFTALHLAAQHGKFEVVEVLVNDKRVKLNQKNSDGANALHLAARHGHDKIVGLLLSTPSDADVSQDMSNGSTILHMAAQRGHAKVVKALLKDKRVNPNKQNDEGANALHLAAEKGHNDVVVSLLSFDDIEINAKLLGGFTALHLAAQYGKLQVAKTLLDNERIKPDQRNDQNMSALHVAAKNGHADVVAALLLKLSPTEINAEVSLKFTALHLAAQHGKFEVVEVLVNDKRVKLNQKNSDGANALHLAARHGHDKMVGLLLSTPIEVNAKTSLGYTPLYLAAQYGKSKVVKVMLKDKRIELDHRSEEGFNAFCIAIAKGHADIVDLLLLELGEGEVNARNIIEFNPLHLAAHGGQAQIAKALLENKHVKPNQRNKQNATPLHLAVQERHLEVIRLLLNRLTPGEINDPWPVNIAGPGAGQPTVLHFSVICEHLGILQVLVASSKIAINATFLGLTALEFAVGKNHLDMVKLLLTHPQIDLNANGNIVDTAKLMVPPNAAIIEALTAAAARQQAKAAVAPPPSTPKAAPPPAEQKAMTAGSASSSGQIISSLTKPKHRRQESLLSCVREWEKYRQHLEKNPLDSYKPRAKDVGIIAGLKDRSEHYDPDFKVKKEGKKHEADAAAPDAKSLAQLGFRIAPTPFSEEIRASLEERNYFPANTEKMGEGSDLCFVHVSSKTVEEAERAGVWAANKTVLMTKGGIPFVSKNLKKGEHNHPGLKQLGDVFEIVCKVKKDAIGKKRICNGPAGGKQQEKAILWPGGPPVTIIELDQLTDHAGVKEKVAKAPAASKPS